MEKSQADFTAKYVSRGQPLLEKSFDHHDTKKNGVLDKEEAAVFLSHVVEQSQVFAQACVAQAMSHSFENRWNLWMKEEGDHSFNEIMKRQPPEELKEFEGKSEAEIKAEMKRQ
eukprot:gene8022-4762_t